MSSGITITAYDQGDVVRIEANVVVNGVATNPTLSTLTVQDPAGTKTTHTIANGGLTNPSVGLLRHDHDTTSGPPGIYTYGFRGTGFAQVYEEGRFYIRQPGVT
jgi:hypothetical protein